MQPTCPKCESPGIPKVGREHINHMEHLDYTHVCSNEDCGGYFRFEPPVASTLWVAAGVIEAGRITATTLGEVEEEVEADEALPPTGEGGVRARVA